MPELPQLRPKHGDRLLACGHRASLARHINICPYEPPEVRLRPDGTTYEVLWLFACDECYAACSDDPSRIEPREEGMFRDEDEPPPN